MIYITAITGPIEPPTNTSTDYITSDTPLNWRGVYSIVILNAPTCIAEIPMATIARFIATKNSVEWNIKSMKEPIVITRVPAIVGLRLPILETMNPEAGANIKNTNINLANHRAL